MNTIDLQTKKIHERKTIGLMTHLVLGYPTKSATEKLILAMEKVGSDFIELQIPFSDPIADGPTIMKASEQALKNGVTVDDAFIIAKKMQRKISIPIIFMAYYNTVFRYGLDSFCRKAKIAGVAGLIIPDMPIDEEQYEKFNFYCDKYGLYSIRVMSPASNERRLKINAKDAKGFVYCISRFGVTGSRSELDPKLIEYLNRVKKFFKIPIAVGFGIAKSEHIKALKKTADIAIVGSAIIDVIEKNRNKDYIAEVEKFILSLRFSTSS